MRYTIKCINFICGCSSVVEYRLPKPWVTSSNLAIRSNDYMLLFSRSFFVYGSIRLFEVISLHFVTLVTAALLHLRVASLPPISYCMCRHPLHIDFSFLIKGAFFVALSPARFEGIEKALTL